MTTRMQRSIVVAAAVAAIVIAANASSGAYFSQSWGWVALAFLVPSTVLLILDRVTVPGRLRIAFASLVGAFGAWIALSTIWSISPPASGREVERVLVYVAVVLGITLVLRRGDGPSLVAGAMAGTSVIATYALSMRLFPDRLEAQDDPIFFNRLAQPLGFPNSLGLLAVLGLLTAFGLVVHSRRRVSASAAGFVMPLMATTLYFTFSRAAWAALLLAVVVMLLLDPRRWRVLWSTPLMALPSGACVALASRHDALTSSDLTNIDAIEAGHRFAIILVASCLVSAVAGLGARRIARLPMPSRGVRRGTYALLLAGTLAFVVAATLSVGGPASGLHALKERFDTPPRQDDTDLNSRLFTLYGTGRGELWRVAYRDFRAAPAVGQGAGSFEYSWYEKRATTRIVRDAHSLYLEVMSELGIVGLSLLAAALIVPLIAARRARRSRYVVPAASAYCTWLAASAFDWHWEMVGVSTTALLIGSAGLVDGDRGSRGRLLLGSRLALVGVTATLSVLAVWSLVGNQALFGAREALARRDWIEARGHADRARALLVWSAEPDIALGDAEAGLGDRAGALRAYRAAVDKDPRNWVAWLRVAQVARGAESDAAYDQVRELNPREGGLPGE